MIITKIERFEDRDTLSIEINERKYFCDRFKYDSLKESLWTTYDCCCWFEINDNSYRCVIDEEKEELELLLKQYYRTKKLERL